MPKYSIATAVENTNPPPIPKIRAWADEYRSNPHLGPVVDLSQGVPGTAPHPVVLDALGKTAEDPQVAAYGPIIGETALREALAEEANMLYHSRASGPSSKYGNVISTDSSAIEDSAKHSGKTITSDDIAITAGGNMAFLTILMALCPPHTSSVLLPMPAYFSHTMSLSLQSVKPVYVACDPDNSFQPSISAAREYLAQGSGSSGGGATATPKLLLLINPSNPTGTVLSHDQLREWYLLAREYKVALVVDETYRDFVVGENGERGKPHALFDETDWRDTLISLGSFSKSYRIPGYRLGTITAHPDLLKRIATICDCMQICAPRVAQIALAPLLPSLRSDLLSSSQALAHRRTLFREIISTIPGWKVSALGGYFAYVSFPVEYQHASSALGLKRKNLGSEDIARAMALRVGVVVLPGSFAMPDVNDDEIWEGVLGGKQLREDRWLRFAVANVGDETIKEVGPRLLRFNEIMGVS